MWVIELMLDIVTRVSRNCYKVHNVVLVFGFGTISQLVELLEEVENEEQYATFEMVDDSESEDDGLRLHSDDDASDLSVIRVF